MTDADAPDDDADRDDVLFADDGRVPAMRFADLADADADPDLPPGLAGSGKPAGDLPRDVTTGGLAGSGAAPGGPGDGGA
jgi:hypothetical protein